MSKEKTFRTVIRVPESVHACMKERAYDMGLGDERGPGLSKYLIGLHVAHMAEMDRLYTDLIADAFPKPAEVVPDVITFEGMTPGEQWHFLNEVRCLGDDWLTFEAGDLMEDGDAIHGLSVSAIYPDESVLGYQARYDAALEYVKGVMDGK
jgi:hypothetical protein